MDSERTPVGQLDTLLKKNGDGSDRSERKLRMAQKSHLARGGAVFLCGVALCAAGIAQEPAPRALLDAAQWKQLDAATDRALEFLAKKQQDDGSFEAPPAGQPAITSLCVLAFLARGHIPNEGVYGAQLNRAIEFVLATQQENGLLLNLPIGANWVWGLPSHTSTYNHAIAGLMLGEVYGMSHSGQREQIREAIRKAVEYTREQQLRPKRHPSDAGGWRYSVIPQGSVIDSDLSVTAWHLMFLRSARNAEFDVPKLYIDEAMKYVHGAFDPNQGAFTYGQTNPEKGISRAMVGSGILLLSLGGEHQTDAAKSAGKWILKNSAFHKYNYTNGYRERYHYSAYYCSQAMFQLGGEYWVEFFPPFMRTLLGHQRGDGSWDAESNRDGPFGNVYTTALTVLALTPPYQLLPIYQR
jgi:hypothetical protein